MNEVDPKARDRERRRACQLCEGTGWKEVVVGDVHRRVRCDHGQNSSEGLVPVSQTKPFLDLKAQLDERFSQVDRAIATVIERHRGAGDPVTISDIAEELWPETWHTVGAHATIERGVKDSIARLLTVARMPIGVSRRPPYGYYTIQTPEELNRNRETTRANLIAWARRLRAYDPDGSWARELYGELALELGVIAEDTETAEVKG